MAGIRMTYRLKLFLLLSALVAATNGFLAYVNYQDCQNLLRTEIHRKVRAVASTSALLIGTDLVTAAESVAHEGTVSPEYARLSVLLHGIRDANRRDDVWVERIFLLVAAREDPRVLKYAFDTEDRLEFRHRPGDVY